LCVRTPISSMGGRSTADHAGATPAGSSDIVFREAWDSVRSITGYLSSDVCRRADGNEQYGSSAIGQYGSARLRHFVTSSLRHFILWSIGGPIEFGPPKGVC